MLSAPLPHALPRTIRTRIHPLALLSSQVPAPSTTLAIGVALVLFACALAFLWAGVRLFRQGSISYDKRLNIAKAFRTSGSRQQI